ncbi:non-ribosomal peptide synthetase [Streptomyces mauvecolor]|uniref:Non-ribosomal peptide synthetase n=1 Tax=Streptomyces mauvecolor TaxID=58345 RepID=A0ABV9UT89_9ACTN
MKQLSTAGECAVSSATPKAVKTLATVIEQVRRIAVDNPEAPAASDSRESLSYAELWRRVEALVRLLRAGRARAGTPVGVCMTPTVTRLAALLGTMGIGAPYIPLDPHFPDDRIRAVMAGAGAELVVVDGATAGRFAGLPYGTVDASEHPSYAAAPAGEPALAGPESSALAYVIYTSGSTGTPKGVGVEHGSVSHLLQALDAVLPQMADRAAQRWLAASNFCFDMSIADLYWPLTRGIPLVIADIDALSGRSAQGAEFLLGTLTGGGVTHFQSTPSLVQLMLQDPAPAAALRGLHMVLMGGEIVTPELVAQLRPVPHVLNGYGPTEATVYTTIHACSDRDTEHVPIGRPLPGVQLRVVGEGDREQPPGSPGELLIGGPGLARGYLNDAELTARKFPVLGEGEQRGRWYRTGDLVTMAADATVRYRGRIDSQVKVRGYRVELGEIEAAIRAVPGVEEAAVFPVRDGTGRVTGLTAAAKSAAHGVTGATVRAGIGGRLPSYAVPGTVRILRELPLGVTGKLDRKALERQLTEPPARTAASGSHEHVIAETWGAVLGAEVALDADGNFFDLGGNSVQLGSVLTRLRESFPEAKLQLVEMYRYPTVIALAERIRSGPPSARKAHGLPRPAGNRRTPLSAADRRRLARRTT